MTLFDPADRRDTARAHDNRTTKQAAFIVEALVLLVFILASMAVLMQLFSSARATGIEAHDLSQAIVLASNSAEEFAAEPVLGEKETFFSEEGGKLVATDDSDTDAFSVVCGVEGEKRESGTIYRARIVVERHGSVLYELSSARYVSEDGGTMNEKAVS